MKIPSIKKQLLTTATLLLGAWATQASAHSGTGILDPGGNNAGDTIVVQVACFSDTDLPPHHLYVDIQDTTRSVPGLLLSTQVYDGYGASKMTVTTDTTSGDGAPSLPVAANAIVSGGAQVFYLSISHTKAGKRNFSINYHCQTADNQHILTYVNILQAKPANNLNFSGD